MAREDRLARYPVLLRAHRYLMRRSPALYATADVFGQIGRAEITRRKREWTALASELPGPFRPSSTVLYVLGSGQSINQLAPAAWETIGAADSLGINFWLLHEFVPSAYVQEWIDPRGDPSLAERLEVRREILRCRRDELTGVPFFFRTPATRRRGGRHRLVPLDVERQLPVDGESLVLTSDINLLPLDVDGFTKTIALCARAGLLDERRRWRYLPTTRGTVLWAILFGTRLGYEEIVLCGVDLTNTDYFYEDPDAPMVRLDLPRPQNVQTGRVHKTNDPAEPGPTMQEIVTALAGGLLARRGIDLTVAHAGSLLARELDVHEWSRTPTPR